MSELLVNNDYDWCLCLYFFSHRVSYLFTTSLTQILSPVWLTGWIVYKKWVSGFPMCTSGVHVQNLSAYNYIICNANQCQGAHQQLHDSLMIYPLSPTLFVDRLSCKDFRWHYLPPTLLELYNDRKIHNQIRKIHEALCQTFLDHST